MDFQSIDASLNTPHTVLLALVVGFGFILYGAALVIYRLYFHPLTKFPGPKLAAATQWYETYFELATGGGGQFIFEVKRMHEKYGPIVRINPNEVHIDDVEYYETVYPTSQPCDKPKEWQNRFNMGHATFSTPEHHLHKRRRTAIAPFFAKRKVQTSYVPIIQAEMDRICARLASDYAGKQRVLVLNDMFGSFASDIITKLAFAKSYDFIEQPEFRSDLSNGVKNMVQTAHMTTQFPIMVSLMNALPDWLVCKGFPIMEPVLKFRGDMDQQIRGLSRGETAANEKKYPFDTIFSQILNSKLPPEDLSQQRLQHEAMSLIGAGIETTNWVLSAACYHIISNPAVQERLVAELKTAIPDPNVMPPQEVLEKLRYLSACIDEALRLAYGVVQRSPRRYHRLTLQYKDWTIPPNTLVSMDTYHMHHNESVFPESFVYKPERWLAPKSGDDVVNDSVGDKGTAGAGTTGPTTTTAMSSTTTTKSLSRYMTAFGRGSRQCIGINIAYAELYIGIATLFRRFDFDLFETERADVDLAHDFVSAHARHGSKGVRVMVKG